MTLAYPYDSISINHRNVTLESILAGNAVATTDFERNTFEFIRQWFSNIDVFYLQTSGSTGEPKQIAIRRNQMIASARLTGEALTLTTGMNAVVVLDTKYIAGKMMLARSFVLGLKVIALEPSSEPFDHFPDDTSIDFTALVPYQVQHILESKRPQILNKISTYIIGGAALSESLAEQLKSFNGKAFVTYGMTETISHIALKQIAPLTDKSFSCLPGITVSTDDRGCVVIYAPYIDHPVVTNDVVALINNHQFEWLGRYDNVINSAGVKISPEILEAEIGQLFTRRSINQPFFFFGIPDELLGERLTMVFTSPAPAAEIINEIKEVLRKTFSPYHVPKEFYEAPAFIYTPTKKVNRQKTFQAARLIQ